ncbi:BAR/IMD domain-containing adapter protein 2 isoform X2 [Lepisosteus oculatus]|uniref:BAR/IMD domain-containing adapter protein 2 isoform X2 n=1 Tax=Lepisosteus oculatus TaxID=7918 RepID=UPI0037162EB3
MSRSDEVNKMTENVYKVILEQFNPSLKNFVSMGKQYEKALTGVTAAAKGYFDTLVKLGELASDSQGSKELGDTLFQMAEVHRQIQVQLEEVLKLFHSELLSQLEQKLELDVKYLTATLKKYQSERRSKVDSIERCQSELKKLRRKSQASRHPNKYGDREMQFVELMSRRQGELDTLVAVGYRSALTEERRRYCFLVDRQCAVTKLLIGYHCRVRELLSQKLSSWQQSCAQPTRLPERALNLVRQTAPSPGAAGIAEVLRAAKLGASASLEQRLSVQEVPPLLNGDAQFRSRAPPSAQKESSKHSPAQTARPHTQQAHHGPQLGNHSLTTSQQPPLPSSAHSVSLSHNPPVSSSSSVSQSPPPAHSSLQGPPVPQSAPQSPPQSHSAPMSRALTPLPPPEGTGSPPPSHSPLPPSRPSELYSTATLPLPRRPVSEARLGFLGSTLPRILPLSAPARVEALFPHSPQGGAGEAAAGGACLLHFLAGDTLTLLISEPREGWHYGQNERTGRKGWFPFSYTQPCENSPDQPDTSSPPLSKLSSTSTGSLHTLGLGPSRWAAELGDERCPVSSFHPRPRPCSMVNPDTCTLIAEMTSPPSSPTRTNPFAHVRLRKTVTNDRSAPLIQ